MGALRWEVASQMWVGTDPRRSDLIQELDVLAAAMVKKKKRSLHFTITRSSTSEHLYVIISRL